MAAPNVSEPTAGETDGPQALALGATPAPLPVADGDRAAEATLSAFVRAVPAAVELARSAAGEAVSLSFGQSLGVELRASAAGVELVLRSDAHLARVAAAELPRMVAALRGRGVRIARAELRPSLAPHARPSGAAPGGRRVDAAAGLR